MVASVAAAGLASVAMAQPYPPTYSPPGYERDRQPVATLYEFPDFQGRSVTVRGRLENLSDLGFNDMAQSVRVEGAWKLCEDAKFRSRCEVVNGSVRDLSVYQMSRRASSIESLSNMGEDRPAPGWPAPGADAPYRPPVGPSPAGVEGRTATFFPRPQMAGSDVAALGRTPADDFCRRSGYGAAVYFDISERSRRAVDVYGRPVGDGPVLRDVLCRR
jgi:hypothetical protein